jgi:hypothetical protein
MTRGSTVSSSSTIDRTTARPKALARHPKVELRPFPPEGASFVTTVQALWNSVWKESRGKADWVLTTNVDEFFHHPGNMRDYLERCTGEGITIIHPRGYEMVAARFPASDESIVETARMGAPMFGQDKRQLFDPAAIDEINFGPGRHECRPAGRVSEPRVCETSIFHYKYVDPHAYLIPRQKLLGARLLDGDRRQGFGRQYFLTAEQIMSSFAWLELHATDVVTPTRSPEGH